ncbi:phenylalanine--tRNA ligase subunit beta [Thalassoroseus pseudoceratinae]|uniref:phenylalanine--tRNA ligase subunit beta n=1 Tax=Thalassoroseus pseudoceratinae TaxID=2713176 RepID=UPI0014205840|nr:phenylalanine--tRNA ligase subunit beta [Thalassoroseus pseudoceratinae]
MLVSWNWLKEYVALEMSVEELTDRLTMSGLNLEGVHHPLESEVAIDLEVTSNRPDCLGHIGVAREISVLFDQELSIPTPHLVESTTKASDATSVSIEDESLCPQYIARVIRGVKIGPSPDWLVRRLQTASFRYNSEKQEYETYRPINNVVDITNYVMLECGQPLHAFDFHKLHGEKIVVRRAKSKEKLTAIDHKDYELSPENLVIADADRPVAIAGVMGGADTEVTEGTTDLLIEAADFAALSVRSTARKLKLHSDSSYRFERGVDPEGIDWTSRRCCELIHQIAGGDVLAGSVVAGRTEPPTRPPIVLRFSQLKRILGIEIPRETATRILVELGMEAGANPDTHTEFVPPSWRSDLTREADLIEEVARIHGYDKIPDDADVPLTASAPTLRERTVNTVRDILTAAGFFEAITPSLVTADSGSMFQSRPDTPPLAIEHSDFRRLNTLRQSLIPSLLESRRENERQSNANAQLFEIAKVYLAAKPGAAEEQVEPTMIGLVTGRSFRELKGVLETLAKRVNRTVTLEVKPSGIPQFIPGRGAEVLLNGEMWGWLGELDPEVGDRLSLQDPVTVAEVSLAALERLTDLTPQMEDLPKYPSMQRDFNFALDESVAWRELADTIQSSGGPLLESVEFDSQFRGKQLGANKKSYIARVTWRSPDRTLTSEEVETFQKAVIETVEKKLDASLR